MKKESVSDVAKQRSILKTKKLLCASRKLGGGILRALGVKIMPKNIFKMNCGQWFERGGAQINAPNGGAKIIFACERVSAG